jgi:hypothetical protein
MKKIFYEKVGRRYKPVYEYDQTLLDSFPKGNHLVMCYPGGQSTRYHVNPALAPMIAAGRIAEDKIREAVHKASEGRPQKQELTPAQIEAWQNMQKALGDDRFYLQYPSIVNAIEAGMKAMQDEAEKLLTNPSVKKAYEHFLLVCELTKEQTNE